VPAVKIKILIPLLMLLLTLLVSVKIDRYITISFEVENPNNIRQGSMYYDDEYKIFSYSKNKVDIAIDISHIESLRFDPMDGAGTITIKKVTINNQLINHSKLSLKPLHSIEKIIKKENSIEIICKGSDPHLELVKDIDALYDWENIYIDYNALIFMFLLGSFILLYFLVTQGYSEHTNKKIFLFLLAYHINILYILMSTIADFNLSNINMSKFLIEFSTILLLTLLLFNKQKLAIFIGILLLYAYTYITFLQIASLEITGEFISILALENIEFIGYMMNIENFIIVTKLIIILLFIPYAISNYFGNKKLFTSSILMVVTVSSLIVSVISLYIGDKKNNEFKKSSLKRIDMIQSFVENFDKKKQTISPDLQFISELKKKYKIDLGVKPYEDYPLKKNYISKNKMFKSRKNKPNVILIFTEGLSARTIGPYNEKFKELTPNIQKFSEHSSTMKVENYYNHTAATYKGLHGQLCSIYPTDTGSKTWLRSKLQYTCLPGILRDNNYETTYLNTHYKNSSGIDEVMMRLGFNDVFSGEELSKKYLGSLNIYASYLLDNQAYEVLENYLVEKEHKKTEKPFFISMYTAETHAWVDVRENVGGVIYGNGNNEALNTIHNMDNAFGKFWKYFKKSKYFDNTVVIFTTDHCHYFDLEYLRLMKDFNEKDYIKRFVDKVPLLFYSPYNDLKKKFDAKDHTSIDLAPTILNYLNINEAENSFIGESLFDQKIDFGYSSKEFMKDGHIFGEGEAHEDNNLHELMTQYMIYTQYLEQNNKLHAETNR
jgi:phosphoglycerol transferase MdoB-like AlkP superfamily enzyme